MGHAPSFRPWLLTLTDGDYQIRVTLHRLTGAMWQCARTGPVGSPTMDIADGSSLSDRRDRSLGRRDPHVYRLAQTKVVLSRECGAQLEQALRLCSCYLGRERSIGSPSDRNSARKTCKHELGALVMAQGRGGSCERFGSKRRMYVSITYSLHYVSDEMKRLAL